MQSYRHAHSRCSASRPIPSQRLQEAQLSPRNIVEILFYCYTNNANRSRGSLRSSFSNCHILFCYLHSFYCCTRIVALGISIAQQACNAVRVHQQSTDFHITPCWCQLDSNCNQPTSTTTSVVDDTTYYFASAPSWTRTTAADGHEGFKQQK